MCKYISVYFIMRKSVVKGKRGDIRSQGSRGSMYIFRKGENEEGGAGGGGGRGLNKFIVGVHSFVTSRKLGGERGGGWG